MKKTLLCIATMLCFSTYAQDHFAGISTSKRGGIVTALNNPAELVNLKDTIDVNIFSVSVNAANNQITLKNVFRGDDLEDIIFSGTDPVNGRGEAEVLGPAFAMKIDKWAFGISSAAKVNLAFVDINPELGNALLNSDISGLFYPTNIDYNQRATTTAWGEIGFSVAREVYNNEKHRFAGGVTFKLLFPGSYADMSIDQLNGTLVTTPNDVLLTDATAYVNFAYSGSLADADFSDVSNYTGFFAGGLNGFATDLGVNYQWLDEETKQYKINAGLSVKNMGSMTFKDDENVDNTYSLDIPENEAMSLSDFNGVETIEEAEEVLRNSPYATITESQRDFKVKLPTVLSLYADVKVYNKWYATAYLKQKLNDDNETKQIATQNVFSVIPRYSTEMFEAFIPLSVNEISGFAAGAGFRIGGFYLGSGSVFNVLFSDAEQADVYLGFRFGI